MIERDFFGEGAHRFHRWLEIGTVIVAMHVGAGAAATLQWPERIPIRRWPVLS
ncbi:MAG: hypothetical protein A49_22040 [Methyloceanibacter sp.]|nr:MAG: hypothetical protein A49_22040 [Methyloceanibacter sp.]